jgi:hypothetical protein
VVRSGRGEVLGLGEDGGGEAVPRGRVWLERGGEARAVGSRSCGRPGRRSIRPEPLEPSERPLVGEIALASRAKNNNIFLKSHSKLAQFHNL